MTSHHSGKLPEKLQFYPKASSGSYSSVRSLLGSPQKWYHANGALVPLPPVPHLAPAIAHPIKNVLYEENISCLPLTEGRVYSEKVKGYATTLQFQEKARLSSIAGFTDAGSICNKTPFYATPYDRLFR